MPPPRSSLLGSWVITEPNLGLMQEGNPALLLGFMHGCWKYGGKGLMTALRGVGWGPDGWRVSQVCSLVRLGRFLAGSAWLPEEPGECPGRYG